MAGFQARRAGSRREQPREARSGTGRTVGWVGVGSGTAAGRELAAGSGLRVITDDGRMRGGFGRAERGLPGARAEALAQLRRDSLVTLSHPTPGRTVAGQSAKGGSTSAGALGRSVQRSPRQLPDHLSDRRQDTDGHDRGC